MMHSGLLQVAVCDSIDRQKGSFPFPEMVNLSAQSLFYFLSAGLESLKCIKS